MLNQGNRSLEEMDPKETGLELFFLQHLMLESRTQGLKMVMVLKRKATTELLTTFLPSSLLMFITFATTFLTNDHFEAGLGANLTIMLLLLTIFTNKIAELPPTSDVKMIDYWLVGCLFYPFLEVLLEIVLMRLSNEEKENDLLKKGDQEGFEDPKKRVSIYDTFHIDEWDLHDCL